MSSSLKQKTVKGISWNLIERFGIQIIKLMLGIILARLLTPEDFGLIGMITVFFAIANVFISSGFGQAYIQKKNVTDVDANTVFFTNLVISLVIYAMLWISAPLIANFYEAPQLIELTRVMGMVVLINAFNIIQVAQVNRKLDFKRKTKITVVSTIISGVAGVSAAYYGLGVWSLVIQQLTNRFLITTGLWITNKWNPALKFSIESFKSMFSYGSWLLFSGIIKTVFDNIYILTIGKFFPAGEVGFYTKSKQFQKMASKQISGAVGTVSFPVLSKVQDDVAKLQNGMKQFLKYTMVFMIPLLVTLIVVAEPFVILLLKEKWAPMIPYLQLLCIVGILYPMHAINIQVLKAQGKSKLNFRLTLVKNAFRIINIIVMYRFGVIYIIIGEIIVSLLALMINTYYTNKLINYGILKQIKDVKHITIGGGVAGIIGYFATFKLTNLWLIFVIGIIGTMGFYILIQYVFNRNFFREVISLKENFKTK
jgi:O-antigen/teichoic acid export membrane protein